MRVYKNILLRIAGLPFSSVSLPSGLLPEMIKEWQEDGKELIDSKESVLEGLMNYNKELSVNPENKKLVQGIQNLRRSIFNDRVSEKERKFISSAGLPDKIPALGDYLSCLDQRDTLLQTINQLFEEQYKAETEYVYDYLENEVFMKGIAMSSHSLLNDLLNVQKKGRQEKRDVNRDRSLLQYLSRASTKTSPFSTLCNIGIATIDNNEQKSFLTVIDDWVDNKKNSFARVNTSLLGYFKRRFQRDNDLLRKMEVELNSSLIETGDQYSLMITQQNTDYFQLVQKNDSLSFIVDLLRQYKTMGIEELIGEFGGETESDEAEVLMYVKKCIDLGLLQLHFGVSATDADWSLKLLDLCTKKFSGLNNASADKLISALALIQDSLSDFGNLSPVDRRDSLTVLKKEINLSLYPIEQKTANEPQLFTAGAERLVYEDTLWSTQMSINKTVIEEIGAALFNLERNLGLFDARRWEKDRMYNFFIGEFKDNDKIPLLTVYEKYYKQVRKAKPGSSAVDPQSIDAGYESKRKEWKSQFLKKISITGDCSQVSFSMADLKITNEELEVVPVSANRSYASFLQLSLEARDRENSLRYCVVNSVFPGYFRMMTRFLHLFPENITDGIRNDLKKYPGYDSFFAEIQDSSHHNANLHPVMVEYEINIPGCNTTLLPEAQINVSDIFVIKKDNQIYLTYNDKIVYPLDLGFLAFRARSELFKFLSFFSYAENVTSVPLVNMINEKVRTDQDIKGTGCYKLPRIILDDKIVLQRETWVIHISELPARLAGQSLCEYYLAVSDWKKRIGLPAHIFFRAIGPLLKPKITSDHYKPQYLRLDSILFVSLLEKLVKKVEDYAYIEEMLPLPEEMIQVRDSSYATEFYLQIDDFNEG